MNLRGIDLNLLVVLDALLEEAHVSRAADRLGLSQPATSSALERCRHLFGDRLLERATGGMRLTSKAEALRPRLKDALAGVVDVLAPPEVPLTDLHQTVRLLMADNLAALLLGPLVAALSRTALGLDLVVQPWHGAPAALEALTRGTLDHLAASVFGSVGADIRREELLRESYVVAMRHDHPAVAGSDLNRWLFYPHVLVSGRGEVRGALDEALARHGRTRRVGLVVPNFLLVPPLLLASDSSRCCRAARSGRRYAATWPCWNRRSRWMASLSTSPGTAGARGMRGCAMWRRPCGRWPAPQAS